MPLTAIHLGIDDVDSREYGCTTYFSSFVIDLLIRENARFFDYPNLVRLNPNIPWKTRGNGAVALRFYSEDSDGIFGKVVDLLDRYYERYGRSSDPAFVMLSGDVDEELNEFYRMTLTQVVHKARALRIVERKGLRVHCRGNGNGVIGAIAAIGAKIEEHTYELMAYRAPENFGKKRLIEERSVIEMDEFARSFTFNNYDPKHRRVLITPRGKDPVLFGVRGTNPKGLWKCVWKLRVFEPITHFVLFRSNQGTNAHLTVIRTTSSFKSYYSGRLISYVDSDPIITRGGHVFFYLSDSEGVVRCGAYEPTKEFRNVILSLRKEDLIEVAGGMRRPSSKEERTLNIEYIRIISLKPAVKEANPRCPLCGKRMKSEGRGKGLSCKRCKYRLARAVKEEITIDRGLKEGSVYVPPSIAHRHLTKPLALYGVVMPKEVTLPLTDFFVKTSAFERAVREIL